MRLSSRSSHGRSPQEHQSNWFKACTTHLTARCAAGRARFGRPLTLTEKILLNHLGDPTADIDRGGTYNDFHPDRVAMQDATAQMALLQFMTAGLPTTAVPSTVHCDHLISAKVGARIDLGVAIDTNKEVYDFLRSVSAKFGIGFWGPGSGIIHQVVLENYAFPGGMMIGTDSHTPNAGGLGMVGDRGRRRRRRRRDDRLPLQRPLAEGDRCEAHRPFSGWSAPKDVILEVARVPDSRGRHGRHRRVLRARRRHHLGDGQGHHLQHGRRDRRHVQRVRIRPEHGDVPEVHRARGHRRRRRQGRQPIFDPTTARSTTN